RGLDRMLMMDRAIKRTSELAGDDTLLLFTADHSFDLQLRGGKIGEQLLEGVDEAQEQARVEKRSDVRTGNIRMENGHAGEPVIAAAKGPGADRVRGFMKNTDLFDVMMHAFGWQR